MDWESSDELLRSRNTFGALISYRNQMRTGLKEAMDSVYERGASLLTISPERFVPRENPRTTAQERLQASSAAVQAIEAVWDGDTLHDWFLVLLPSSSTPLRNTHASPVHDLRQ